MPPEVPLRDADAAFCASPLSKIDKHVNSDKHVKFPLGCFCPIGYETKHFGADI